MKNFYAVSLVAGRIFLGACVATQVGVKPVSAQEATTSTKTEPQRWEYQTLVSVYGAFSLSVIYVDPTTNKKYSLNQLGDDGWELVGFDPDRHAIFKRQKPLRP